MTTSPTTDQSADVLAAITAATAALDTAQREVERLTAARLALYAQARELDPPVSLRTIGAAAGISSVAVHNALRRAADAAAVAAADAEEAGRADG